MIETGIIVGSAIDVWIEPTGMNTVAAMSAVVADDKRTNPCTKY
jgi:hypothetical protein